VDAEALQREALSAIEAASTPGELEELRVSYLGRSSDLKLALREVRDRETGMLLNGVRERLESVGGSFDSGVSEGRWTATAHVPVRREGQG
jgi:hypothetical protein